MSTCFSRMARVSFKGSHALDVCLLLLYPNVQFTLLIFLPLDGAIFAADLGGEPCAILPPEDGSGATAAWAA